MEWIQWMDEHLAMKKENFKRLRSDLGLMQVLAFISRMFRTAEAKGFENI